MLKNTLIPFRAAPISVALAALLLGSCGGGGSSPTPTPPPAAVNNAPQFTSTGNASANENSAGIVYNASGSDADGDAITFSISGGEDASQFQISPSGQLRFVSAPNFENPSDANGDNSYQVTLSVSDGQANASLNLSLQVDNIADAARLTRIGAGLGDVVSMSAAPAGDVLIVANSSGDVFEVDPGTGTVLNTGNILNEPGTGDYRILTLAPLGEYRENSRRVFALIIGFGGNLFIRRYTKNPGLWSSHRDDVGAAVINPDIAANLVASSVMAPDGSVYIMAGDGGASDRAQDGGPLGGIIRVLRNPNTFSGAGVVFFVSEKLGNGLHAPTGGSFIGDTLIFSDTGDTQFDELNRLEPMMGQMNFGWPFKEGRTTVSQGATGDLVEPVLEFDRAAGAMAAQPIVAGQYYEGPLVSLNERFVSATADGRFFVAKLGDLQAGSVSTNDQFSEVINEFQTDAGTLDEVIAITLLGSTLCVLDADGEVYRVDLETV
ncbi:PQQ-dependent sugar dehydrogenase [Pontixanthobacter sp. CEM42]|uniref:PQQ-dependent sugar dehydrogenase n=1 Tax=Pontixanthobacter sp. CEM42 TaxID=2792077 RepID=UPI001ADFCF95|nr:PQQ-dependent sugar dehydrogenase [Pontixanthobacter sp. CEM42]